MSAFKDRTGCKMGRLKVVCLSGSTITARGKKKYFWACACDCGKLVEVEGSNFSVGHTLSCGCLRDDERNERTGKSDAAFRALLREYKNSARKDGVPFSLTDIQFRNLTSGFCFYCGGEPRRVRFSASKRESYIYNGIDKDDSKIGYVVGNCVPACWDCNEMKSDRTLEEFLQTIKTIYKYAVEEK